MLNVKEQAEASSLIKDIEVFKNTFLDKHEPSLLTHVTAEILYKMWCCSPLKIQPITALNHPAPRGHRFLTRGYGAYVEDWVDTRMFDIRLAVPITPGLKKQLTDLSIGCHIKKRGLYAFLGPFRLINTVANTSTAANTAFGIVTIEHSDCSSYLSDPQDFNIESINILQVYKTNDVFSTGQILLNYELPYFIKLHFDVSTQLLLENNIRFKEFVQQQGDLVVTPSGSIHQVVNLSTCENVAINITTKYHLNIFEPMTHSCGVITEFDKLTLRFTGIRKKNKNLNFHQKRPFASQ